jgi:hypothetical protein
MTISVLVNDNVDLWEDCLDVLLDDVLLDEGFLDDMATDGGKEVVDERRRTRLMINKPKSVGVEGGAGLMVKYHHES